MHKVENDAYHSLNHLYRHRQSMILVMRPSVFVSLFILFVVAMVSTCSVNGFLVVWSVLYQSFLFLIECVCVCVCMHMNVCACVYVCT